MIYDIPGIFASSLGSSILASGASWFPFIKVSESWLWFAVGVLGAWYLVIFVWGLVQFWKRRSTQLSERQTYQEPGS